MMRNIGILSLLAACYLTGLVTVDLLDSGDPATTPPTGWSTASGPGDGAMRSVVARSATRVASEDQRGDQ